jgi:hypothetical protein
MRQQEGLSQVFARVSLVTLLATTCLPTLARAEPITFRFTGTVIEDRTGMGATAVAGTYTFDSATPLVDGRWTVSGPPYGLELTLDTGYQFESDVMSIGVVYDPFGVDVYFVHAPPALAPLVFPLVQLGLSGPSLITDVRLPLTPPPLPPGAQAPNAALWFVFLEEGRYVGGQLRSLERLTPLDPVPEPATMTCVGGGIMLLAAFRRRWKTGNRSAELGRIVAGE